MLSKHPHVIIVGAGIVGASLAYHLISQNARVTLLDKATKPANDATEKSFAWITVAHDIPKNYLNLRQQAIADWHRVETEFGGRFKIDWSGALSWRDDTVETARIARSLIADDYPVRLVSQQEIRRLEPNLKNVPTQAIFAENEGALNPILVTEFFIKAAREAGADIQLGSEVLSLITNAVGVAGVVTATSKLAADVVVLATGANTAALCQPLGVMLPIEVSPAILMQFHANHQFVNRIISNSVMEMRAVSDTLVIAAEDYIDESIDNNPWAIAQRTIKEIKNHWQGADTIKLKNVVVGKRPIPQDKLPIIGQINCIDGLYIAVMHAGVTLAAIGGRLVAAEILNNKNDSLLASFRPERFDNLV